MPFLPLPKPVLLLSPRCQSLSLHALMDFSLLLCDEEFPLTPLPSLANSPSANTTDISTSPFPDPYFADVDDHDEAVRGCLQKELSYMPSGRYVNRLRQVPELARLRLMALRWIIMACAQLNFSYLTTFRAVNYMDRFASTYCHMDWQCWMMELLGIACLSIAAKVEEIAVPHLQAFPMDDLDHCYESPTIQRMELLVLRALDWSLYCVTPHSYVDMMTWSVGHLLPQNLASTLRARVNDRLLCMLSDVDFLIYRPFVLAMTALKFGMGEVYPQMVDSSLSNLCHLIPDGAVTEMDKCAEKMQKLMVDPSCTSKWNICYPPSPVTVIRRPRRRPEMTHKYLDLDLFFGGEATNAGPEECKRQKR